jgi:hypothetical protein
MATPATGLPADQLSLALYSLSKAPEDIFNAIYVLNLLGYTTPATDLQSALTTLNTAIASAKAAVAAGTLG